MDPLVVPRALWRSGVYQPLRPDRNLKRFAPLVRWGRSPAAGAAALAKLYGDETFIVDELGTVSFGELEARTNALADRLEAEGIGPGDSVGLMCRNHRYFVEGLIAASKLGCRVLLLNTDFAGPQLAGVIEREKPVAVICDEEFAERIEATGVSAFIAWSDGESEVEAMIAAGDRGGRKPPPEPGRLTILSSGTTGTPKGVQRESGGSLAPMLGYVERVGLRARETMVLPAPMFHGWGLFHLGIALLTGHTLVLQRRFDAEATLAQIEEHRAQVAPMVPAMLLRILELRAATRERYDVSSLTAVPLGGSAIPGGLAGRAMDALGDVLSNTYGSTEVAMASVATPEDLRADESSAGRPLPGTKVAILSEEDGRRLPIGETGVIFVGSKLRSEGYSDGTGKEERHGMLSSGDLGHLDESGQLFVDGREDDMIVSGGENVFPGEVEDLLTNHPAIADAAVIGVADERFGQRVRAFVVLREGERIDADGVRSHVKENLARYKVPREVDFLDELPRNPTGKILKRELARRRAV